jgi:methylmalonyl-CoA/ethylmalonyl-CoA epimerase
MIKKINHIGIAVKDLDKAVEFFEKSYGAKLLDRKIYADLKLESAFMAMGEAMYELSAALEPTCLLNKYIETRGEGIHHVSLQVDAFELTIKKFKERGLKVIEEADTDDFKAAFLHPQGNLGMLTEIIEPKEGSIFMAADKD